MLSTLYFSAKLILSIFTASKLSAFLICFYNNIPFFNPTHNRYQLVNRIEKIVKSAFPLLKNSVVIYGLFLDRLIENRAHSLGLFVYNIAMYSIITEFFYYLYHNVIHTQKYYKEHHSLHHKNIEVYPIDTFYIEQVDGLFLIGSLSAPIVLLRLNYFEFITCLYVYITAATLAHSPEFFNHHAIHHKLLVYNYCILNPAFDIIFKTYKW
jgi:sterol desaturase/sphingolipid hydroxylase (fatty acid hydroxylase superfamily)